MDTHYKIEEEISKNTDQLKNLKFEKLNNEFIVTLIDSAEYEIIRGYGKTIIAAINDLHHNLL